MELVEDERGWLALQPEWDALLATLSRPGPFLQFTWLDTWRRHFARHSRLYVLLARQPGGGLAGAAPLHIVPRRSAGIIPLRSLEFLGYRGSAVCADHLDFLAVESERARVAECLAVELLRPGHLWDVLVLADLAQDSPLPALFERLAPKFTASVAPAEVCYYVPMPAQVADFWAQIKRLHPVFARGIRRYHERLRRDHEVRFLAPVPPSQVGDTLADLARLHGLAHRAKGEAGNFSLAPYFAFHAEFLERMASDPGLYLARLEVDGAAAAIMYGFVAGSVLYLYQQGYDPAYSAYSIGKLLLTEVLDDAITRLGVREVDFLRGGEGYKSHWTDLYRTTRTFHLWRGGLPARLAHGQWRSRRVLGGWRRTLRTGFAQRSQ